MNEPTRRNKAIAAYNAAVVRSKELSTQLDIVETELDVLRIVDNAILEDEKYKNYTSYVMHSFSQATHIFSHNQTPVVNWLRAVERMAKIEYDYKFKIAVIERYTRKQDVAPEEWLRQMNSQISAYIGSDVELTFKVNKK